MSERTKKMKVVQIGIRHEHAPGKILTLTRFPELFEVAGYVDEADFCHSPNFEGSYRPHLYTGYRKLSLDEVWNIPDLDAAIVEVPNKDLVPVGMLCLEHNLAMHLDKPAGESLAPYAELLDGCRKRGVPLQMGYMFRGNPAFRYCIRAIREGLLGEIASIETDMHHSYGGEVYQEYIANFAGGIMFNLGCHLIDFVVAAMGRPAKVTPFLGSAPGDPDRVRNHCMAVLEYPHAFVTLSACSRNGVGGGGTEARAMRITGTKGMLRFSPLERFDGKPVEIELWLKEDSDSLPAGRHLLSFPVQKDRYVVQLTELGKIVRGEITNPYTYDHDLLVHEVTLAAAGYIEWK